MCGTVTNVIQFLLSVHNEKYQRGDCIHQPFSSVLLRDYKQENIHVSDVIPSRIGAAVAKFHFTLSE